MLCLEHKDRQITKDGTFFKSNERITQTPFSKCEFLLTLHGRFLTQSWVLYQMPESSSVLASIFAIPSTPLSWTEMPEVFPGIGCSQSSSLGVTDPFTLITTGSPVTSQVFSCPSPSPWYVYS